MNKRSKDELLEQLKNELKHLRGVIREVGENFILRREGEIETIISFLEGVPAARLKHDGPLWLREIRNMQLKPPKGRIKDLKAVDGLLDEMIQNLVTVQERASSKGKG